MSNQKGLLASIIALIIAALLITGTIGFLLFKQRNPNKTNLPSNVDPFTQSPKEVQECISKIIGVQALSELKNKKRPTNQQDKEASKTCLTEYYKPKSSPSNTYSKEITNNQPITLAGNQVLEIKNTHYTQKNDITLKDNAKLIIRDSFFEHLGDSSFKFWLNAYDSSQVIIENSQVKSTPWLNWNFYNH